MNSREVIKEWEEKTKLGVAKQLDECCVPGQRVWWQGFKQSKKLYGTVLAWKNGYWVDVLVDEEFIDELHLSKENRTIEFEF